MFRSPSNLLLFSGALAVASLVCGVASAASGGPDAQGYVYVDSDEPAGPTYDFETGLSNTLTFSFNDDVQQVPIGFPFEFYGTTYTDVFVVDNLYLTFTDPFGSAYSFSEESPNNSDPNNIIAAYWGDWNPEEGGTYTYETLGTAPNRRFVISFEGHARAFTSDPFAVPPIPPDTINVQIKLFENSNAIEVHLGDTPDQCCYTDSVGIENASGTTGLSYYYSDASSATPFSAVRFSQINPLATLATIDPNPTSQTTVTFRAVFEEPVTGVGLDDFQVSVSGNLSGETIDSVTPMGAAGDTYDIEVSVAPAADAAGNLTLELIDNDSIFPVATPGVPLGGPGAQTLAIARSYRIDRVPPVVNFVAEQTSATNGDRVWFDVFFTGRDFDTDLVTNVDVSDFSLTTTGAIAGAFVESVSPSNLPASFNSVLSLDGTGDHAFVPSFLSPSGSFTIEFWMNRQRALSSSGGGGLIRGPVRLGPGDNENFGPEQAVLWQQADAFSSPFGITIGDYDGINVLTDNGTFSDSSFESDICVWVHYAIVFDDADPMDLRLRLYRNGVPLNDYGVSSAPLLSGNLLLGQEEFGINGFGNFEGELDDLRVWSVARTETQIASNLGAPLTGTEAGLLAYYPFDTTANLGVNADGADDTPDGTTSPNHADLQEDAFITAPSPSVADVYRVTVNLGTGEGTVRLNVLDNDDAGTITDVAGNRLAGFSIDDGTYTSGPFVTVDRTPPVPLAIDVQANASIVVTFSEGNLLNVFDRTQYTIGGPGRGTLTAQPDQVTYPAGTQATLSWNPTSGDMVAGQDVTITLDGTVANFGPIRDRAGNDMVSPVTLTDVGGGTPRAPFVSSIQRFNPNTSTTNASSVIYRVTFSEPVAGVDTTGPDFSNFSVTRTGAVTAADVTAVSGSGQTYDVTVGNITGNSGTVRLVFSTIGAVADLNGFAMTTLPSGNLGQTYTIDRIGPVVSSIQRFSPAGATATPGSTVTFRVNFSESVINVGTDNFAVTVIGITGAPAPSITGITGVGTTRNITVNTGGTDLQGEVRLDLVSNTGAAGAITDTLGNPLDVFPFITGATYTIDAIRPSVAGVVIENGTAIRVNFTEGMSSTPATGILNAASYTLSGTGLGTKPVNPTSVGFISGTSQTAVRLGVPTGDFTIGGTVTVTVAGTLTDIAGNLIDAPLSGSDVVDDFSTTPPAVISFTRLDSNPTNAGTVRWRLTWSEDVTGVDVTGPTFDNFSLVEGTGLTGSTITGIVANSAFEYDITASVGTTAAPATLRCDLSTLGNIRDAANNPPTGPASSQTYTIDQQAPTVLSILRQNPLTETTGAASVVFRVAFSEPVQNVGAGNFTLTTTGTLAGTFISGVAPVGFANSFDVTVNTGAAGQSGTLRLDLANTGTMPNQLRDTAGNVLGNAPFTTGESYILDATPPTVVSINRASGNPTSANVVDFTVQFSEDVQSVFVDNFTLDQTGTLTGSTVSAVNGSGATRTVTVLTGTGQGQLRLDLATATSAANPGQPIRDLANLTLAGAPFTGGQAYDIDRTPPTVTQVLVLDGARIRVTFSEPVGTGRTTPGNYVLSGTGQGTMNPSPDSVTFLPENPDRVVLNWNQGDMIFGGTIIVTVNNVFDVAGNLIGNPNFGQDMMGGGIPNPPRILSLTTIDPSPTVAATVRFRAIFSEAISGLDIVGPDFDNFTLGVFGPITGASIASIAEINASTYDITVNTGSGDGVLGLSLTQAGAIIDTALPTPNPLSTPLPFGNPLYVVDRVAPTVVSITPFDPSSPTDAQFVEFGVQFSEIIAGVNILNFSLTTTGAITTTPPGQAFIDGVFGTIDPTFFRVRVNTGDPTRSGTIRLDLTTTAPIIDQVGNPLAAPFTTGVPFVIDREPPVVTRFILGGTPTNASSIDIVVEFNEPVENVFLDNFEVLFDGTLAGVQLNTVMGTGNTRTVNILTGTGDGTIRLRLVTDSSAANGGLFIRDITGNRLANEPQQSLPVEIDRTPPTVVSITRLDANPTPAVLVNYLITFSEAVSPTDFPNLELVATGTLSDFVITEIQLPPASFTFTTTRTVTANTGNGAGTLRLDLTNIASPDQIFDSAGNLLVGLPFTAGETYSIEREAPVSQVTGLRNPITGGFQLDINQTAGTAPADGVIEGTYSVNSPFGTPTVELYYRREGGTWQNAGVITGGTFTFDPRTTVAQPQDSTGIYYFQTFATDSFLIPEAGGAPSGETGTGDATAHYNGLLNGPFTQVLDAPGLYRFPFDTTSPSTGEAIVTLNFAALPMGPGPWTVTVTREPSPDFPPFTVSPTQAINERLLITSNMPQGNFQCAMTWRYLLPNFLTPVQIQQALQFEGSTLLRTYPIEPPVNQTLVIPGINRFSQWYAGTLTLLDVDLVSFEATCPGAGSPVNISWVTAAEFDNAGFLLYRATPGEGGSWSMGERLTPSLIPAEGSASAGASYSFVDEQPTTQGETRAYFLVDIALDGATTQHGPATATITTGAPSNVGNWMLY